MENPYFPLVFTKVPVILSESTSNVPSEGRTQQVAAHTLRPVMQNLGI